METNRNRKQNLIKPHILLIRLILVAFIVNSKNKYTPSSPGRFGFLTEPMLSVQIITECTIITQVATDGILGVQISFFIEMVHDSSDFCSVGC